MATEVVAKVLVLEVEVRKVKVRESKVVVKIAPMYPKHQFVSFVHAHSLLCIRSTHVGIIRAISRLKHSPLALASARAPQGRAPPLARQPAPASSLASQLKEKAKQE